MKKHLVSNWKQVLKEAWSVRFIVAASLLSGVEVALPFMFEARPIAPGVFAAVSGVVTAAALVARVVTQRS